MDKKPLPLEVTAIDRDVAPVSVAGGPGLISTLQIHDEVYGMDARPAEGESSAYMRALAPPEVRALYEARLPAEGRENVTFKILMIDFYHAPDPDEGAYALKSTFPTLEAAVAHAEQIMDEELASHAEPGMSAAQVISNWRAWGEAPSIVPPIGARAVPWSAYGYAEANAAQFIKPPGTGVTDSPGCT